MPGSQTYVEEVSAKGLLHELVVRGVEDAKVGLLRERPLLACPLLKPLHVARVAVVDGAEEARVGEVAVDPGVLGSERGFVKVEDVLHVCCAEARLHNERRVRPDEHDDDASTACGAGRPLLVHGNVPCE